VEFKNMIGRRGVHSSGSESGQLSGCCWHSRSAYTNAWNIFIWRNINSFSRRTLLHVVS